MLIWWIGGAYRRTVEDREVIIQDISATAGVSLGLVLLLVGVAYRDFRALPILFVPLLAGSIFTWGFVAVVVMR